MSRRAFVTGAGGFIGSHLVRELLRAGWEVAGLVRRSGGAASQLPAEMKLLVGDLRDPAVPIPDLDSEVVVFHLAASMTTWSQGVEEGRLSTANLIQQMTARGARRIILLSSAAVHSPRHGSRIVDETMPLGPHAPWNHYVAQKLAAERLVMQARADRSISATIVRPPRVLGAGDGHLVPWAQRLCVWTGGQLARDGNCRYPVVEVTDLVRGLIDCATSSHTAGRDYYLSSATQITKSRLLADLISAGMPLPRRSLAKSLGIRVGTLGLAALEAPWRLFDAAGPRPIVVSALERRAGSTVEHDCVISSRRATDDFGWRCEGDIAAAIHAAVRWYWAGLGAQSVGTLTGSAVTAPETNGAIASGLGIGSSE
jgi:nucleoside-diphosphate-sugar epimerase